MSGEVIQKRHGPGIVWLLAWLIIGLAGYIAGVSLAIAVCVTYFELGMMMLVIICKIGLDEQPLVLTLVMPRYRRAAATLYRATDPEAELHCSILINGIAAVSELGTRKITCDYLEYGR